MAVDPVPTPDPLFTQLLVLDLQARRLAEGPKEKAFETYFRHSDAGKCSRMLALKLLGVGESDPFDLPADWVTSLGTVLHEDFQAALLKKYPDALIEPKVNTGIASGHLDALVTINGQKFCYELKTRNGYGFSKSIGVVKQRGGSRVPAAGPTSNHVIQASLNALGADADYAVIGYLALEAISVQVAANLGMGQLDRIMAEWVIPREVFEPIAWAEISRLEGIAEAVLTDEVIPVAWAVGDDYEQQRLDPNASYPDWKCRYCSYQQICKTLSREAVPLATLEGL